MSESKVETWKLFYMKISKESFVSIYLIVGYDFLGFSVNLVNTSETTLSFS